MKKKNYKLYKNNNGIALISILIAVAFISIIGSALLYITYTNFQMKIMNNRSKANFYEADGEMVNAVMALRDYTSGDDALTKADSIVTVDPNDPTKYVYDVRNAMHFAGIDNGSDGNPADLAWFVPNPGTNPQTYDRFQIIPTGTATKEGPVGGVTTYTLENFTVKQTSNVIKNDDSTFQRRDDARGTYENTVKTNVQLKILEQTSTGGGNKGVGDFSMLMDSPISVASGQFSFVTLYGDAFFSYYDHGYNYDLYGAGTPSFDTFPHGTGDGTYTKPGRYYREYHYSAGSERSNPAVFLQNISKVNIEGKYCVVYGDMVLTGDSCFVINGSGNLTVYGDIYLEDHATLICNGTIYMPESVLPGRENQCTIYYGKNIDGTDNGTTLEDHLQYAGGLSAIQRVSDANFKEFCKELKLNDDKAYNDGVAYNILKKNAAGDKFEIENADGVKKDFSVFDQYKDGKTQSYATSAKYYDTPCKVMFSNQTTDTELHGPSRTNSLIFIARSPGVNNQNITLRPAQNSPTYIPELKVNRAIKDQYEFKDSVINSTVISREPIAFNVQHGVYVSKMGSAMFNYLTVKSKDKTNAYYDSAVHSFDFNDSKTQLDDISAGDFFETTANTTCKRILSVSVNGGSGATTYYNSVSFKGYVKDAD